MAVHTEKAILQTFQEMLEETPFDRITVSALARRCVISPNTFYYHFRDIHALLDVWMRERLARFTPGVAPYEDWRDSAKALLHECRDQARLVGHVLDSLSREQLERFVFTLADDWFDTLLRKAAEGREIPEQKLQELSGFLRYAFMGFFLRFIWNRMQDDIDAAVDSLGALLGDFAAYELGKYPLRRPSAT